MLAELLSKRMQDSREFSQAHCRMQNLHSGLTALGLINTFRKGLSRIACNSAKDPNAMSVGSIFGALKNNRSKDATRGSWHRYQEQGPNKKGRY